MSYTRRESNRAYSIGFLVTVISAVMLAMVVSEINTQEEVTDKVSDTRILDIEQRLDMIETKLMKEHFKLFRELRFVNRELNIIRLNLQTMQGEGPKGGW